MIIRPAREGDFAHLETFVWQAIFPAFDVPGLSPDQRAENDEVVAGARSRVLAALASERRAVFVAIEPRRKTLAGYVIADATPRAYAVIEETVVSRSYWGKGVGEALLDEALNYIGTDRAASVALRHYNARALAFFAKHGFVNTGESTGDGAIPRILLLREAGEDPVRSSLSEDTPASFDFPTAADEPIYAALPDYNLAVDDEPFATPGAHTLATQSLDDEPAAPTTLDEEQLSQLEAFIARARTRKGLGEQPASPQPQTRKIPFEISKPPAKVEHRERTPTPTAAPASFEFAFEETAVAVDAASAPPPSAAAERCANCGAELPAHARFCPACGHPRATNPPPIAVDDALLLPDLPEEDTPDPTPINDFTKAAEDNSDVPGRFQDTISLADLKRDFRTYLQDRVTAYFGPDRWPVYRAVLDEDVNFQQLRDGSLGNLLKWISTRPQLATAVTTRRRDTLADLAEYFIVETAGDLSGAVLPQRLLRHQSVNWSTVDLFRLVMDYLDFARESEVVYTDFVAMPARALRNATSSFLGARKDERVFLICDQSLISAAKNGFAVTDSGLYWKNILQPAGAILFNTLEDVRITQGHLVLNNLFFNAGGTLNLKMALLLDKLRRR